MKRGIKLSVQFYDYTFSILYLQTQSFKKVQQIPKKVRNTFEFFQRTVAEKFF